MVIVGSEDGNRIWGNELRMSLKLVEWSPDGKYIVFINEDAEAVLYSCDGTKIRKLTMPAQDPNNIGDVNVAGFDWYDYPNPHPTPHSNPNPYPNPNLYPNPNPNSNPNSNPNPNPNPYSDLYS